MSDFATRNGGRRCIGKLQTIMLLAAAMLPAWSQAQNVNICDRTPQVRNAIMQAVGANDCAAVDSEQLATVGELPLEAVGLTTLQVGDFDGLTDVYWLDLSNNDLTALPVGVFDGLTNLNWLWLNNNRLTALPEDLFAENAALDQLWLHYNQLTALPEGLFVENANLKQAAFHSNRLTTLPKDLFDGLTKLANINFQVNGLTTLPEGLFDGLTSLVRLRLEWNRLTTLPEGLFDGLTQLDSIFLHYNRLTSLPAGLFDGLTNVKVVKLGHNRLTSLPASLFDDLANVDYELDLSRNRLTSLPTGLFDRQTSLERLYLSGNQLTTLPEGLFDNLTSLQELWLSGNRLATLPEGLFDNLTSLQRLGLSSNYLVGLSNLNPLFAGIPEEVVVGLDGQTTPLAAAVPLMISASDTMRQGFVRIINKESWGAGGTPPYFYSGTVRILAFDDAGNPANPIEIPLGNNQAVHFNADDLENGNPAKGIETGIGIPVQGDWRLSVESDLAVEVLAFARSSDGFLTALHDVLPRDPENRDRLLVRTFNPAGNANTVSKLRLINTSPYSGSVVTISGWDDQGKYAGPVSMVVPRNGAHTLSAFDLENGAEGLTGELGDGAGKWRLSIHASPATVVGMSLLESSSGHITNISATGVATDYQ